MGNGTENCVKVNDSFLETYRHKNVISIPGYEHGDIIVLYLLYYVLLCYII